MEKAFVSKATLGRIPRYIDYLKELSPELVPYISATTISRDLQLGEVQVRKDLAMVSGAGRPRLGYATEELIEKLEEYLGAGRLTHAVLVGAGKLGRAILQYDGFSHFGVEIKAAFDCNDQILNLDSKTVILPMNRFDTFVKEHDIRLGIITVGEGSAQEVCNRMTQSGIEAIWNFAPCKLQVPPSVLLQNENLALSLAYLNMQLSQRQDELSDK
ncbi:MAG: redox-sensing transcriptional repressor Rex [Oscillospiraceae bacterium]|nr:redox-sensing transcriptional repressor Rex [Oscillospiraceae bacterium]